MIFDTHYSKENQCYIGTCDEFPDIMYLDKNEEDAYVCIVHTIIIHIEKLIFDWVQDLKNDLNANLCLCLSKNSDRMKVLYELEGKLQIAYDNLGEADSAGEEGEE